MSGGRWALGSFTGLQIPADLDTLLMGGAEFLTRAFRTLGALSEDNAVREIASWEEFEAGGSGKKARLTVSYETAEPGLPEDLFIKFSRNFDNELWDSARFLMVSEVEFALLAGSPGFPVPVPATLFADVELETGTGLLISERIPYGRDGVEPHYLKCMDYNVPDQVGHYKAILRGLAALSGAHRAGKLSPDFDTTFPYGRETASTSIGAPASEATVVKRAIRLFDFIELYPHLFPEHLRTPELRAQFMQDIPEVFAASDKIAGVLHGNPDFIAFTHWNANIDNCWFERDPDGMLRCGFLDWQNAGQLSVAQAINGAMSGAETFVWDDHLDELLEVFVEEYAVHGGPLLDLDELRFHMLLQAASGLAHSMAAPIAIEREFEDIAALEGPQDPSFADHENARVHLHMATRMLNLWQTRKLGDVVRAL